MRIEEPAPFTVHVYVWPNNAHISSMITESSAFSQTDNMGTSMSVWVLLTGSMGTIDALYVSHLPCT